MGGLITIFVNRRLLHDLETNQGFQVRYRVKCMFNYDIDTYYYIVLVHEYVESSLLMLPMFTIVHPKLWVNLILSLQLTKYSH